MDRKCLERCFSRTLILIGCYVLFTGMCMDIMTEDGPGPGFLPVGLGGILIFLSALVFAGVKRIEKENILPLSVIKDLVIVIAASFLTIFFAKSLGFLLMLGLLAGFLAWYSGARWCYVFVTVFLVCLVFYGIFILFLSGSFPKGYFGF